MNWLAGFRAGEERSKVPDPKFNVSNPMPAAPVASSIFQFQEPPPFRIRLESDRVPIFPLAPAEITPPDWIVVLPTDPVPESVPPLATVTVPDPAREPVT